MKKKIVLGTSLIILFFSLLIFFYFKSNNEKKLIEEEKKVQLVENENLELIEEKIERITESKTTYLKLHNNFSNLLPFIIFMIYSNILIIINL